MLPIGLGDFKYSLWAELIELQVEFSGRLAFLFGERVIKDKLDVCRVDLEPACMSLRLPSLT